MIAFTLPQCLGALFRRAGAPAPACTATPADGERVLGCGWFDSSHDLQAGLRVREHASPDALAAELPLGIWLDWHMAGHSLTVQQQGTPAVQA